MDRQRENIKIDEQTERRYKDRWTNREKLEKEVDRQLKVRKRGRQTVKS